MSAPLPPPVLVDTSAWLETLRPQGDPELRALVARAVDDGTARFCDMVFLELWNGAQGADEKRLLRDLEELVPCVETTEAVWKRSRELAQLCRAAGLTVPATDLLIAACAEHHGMDLLHKDSHFPEIGRLRGRRSR